MARPTHEDWDSAQAQLVEISRQLRNDRELKQLFMAMRFKRSANDATSKHDWWDTFVGAVSSYPLKLLGESGFETSKRNVEFERAIASFHQAVVAYEEASGCSILSLNGAFSMTPAPLKLFLEEHPPASDEMLRRLPDRHVGWYLELLRESVTNGEYGSATHEDPEVCTPAGRRPSNPTSLAARLVIHTLKMLGAVPDQQHHQLAAKTVERLTSSDYDSKTIESMRSQG